MLSDYQLEWLEKTLAIYPQRHTLVVLHHHPLASGYTWLDQHSLRNSHQLDAVLQNYPLAHAGMLAISIRNWILADMTAACWRPFYVRAVQTALHQLHY